MNAEDGMNAGGPSRRQDAPWGTRLVAVALAVGAAFACVSRWTPPEPTGHRRVAPIDGAGNLTCFAEKFDEKKSNTFQVRSPKRHFCPILPINDLEN